MTVSMSTVYFMCDWRAKRIYIHIHIHIHIHTCVCVCIYIHAHTWMAIPTTGGAYLLPGEPQMRPKVQSAVANRPVWCVRVGGWVGGLGKRVGGGVGWGGRDRERDLRMSKTRERDLRMSKTREREKETCACQKLERETCACQKHIL